MGFGLGTRGVGLGPPCLVVAEVGSAHRGSAESALRMVEAAFRMGADGIQFQLFRSRDLVVHRHPERRALEEVELPPAEWQRVLRSAKASGLAVLVEPLDSASLELAREEKVDGLAVHQSDLENPEFIRAVGGAGRPVLLSALGVREEIVAEALSLLAGGPIALLHGSPTAPAPLEEIRFRDLLAWRERYRVPVGFRDRTDGGSAFALLAPALAAAHGAELILKPFRLDRARRGHDDLASLSPEDFYNMVELLRQAERARGDGAATDGESARRARRSLARSIVAGTLIPRGEVITGTMLAFKRTDARQAPGLPPREAHLLIGRRARRPIEADETIREDMLE